MIGKALAHYSVTAQIGKAGMGEVYQAKDQKLGRDVAIKVLPDEFAKDADRVARFVVGLVEKGVRVGFADRFEVIEVNGQPGLIWREPSGQPFGVFVFEVADGQITAIRGIRNPDKLTRFAAQAG